MKNSTRLLFLMLAFAALPAWTVAQIAVVGDLPDMASLDADEQDAYQWAMDTYPGQVTYISFQDIIANPDTLATSCVIWWHYDKNVALPLIASNPVVQDAVSGAHANGTSVFLSGLATQWVVGLGIDDCAPGEIGQAAEPFTNADNWGYLSSVPSHPAFEGLSQPFTTLFSLTGLREDSKAWWGLPAVGWYADQGCDFGGTHLAGTEWDAAFEVLLTVGEYPAANGSGAVIVNGAGAFDWFLEGGENDDRPNLELFAENTIDYLQDQCGVVISVDENALAFKPTRVFPNPASEQATVLFDARVAGEAKMTIQSVDGQQVFEETKQTSLGSNVHFVWNPEGQAKGIYVFTIENGAHLERGKLMVH